MAEKVDIETTFTMPIGDSFYESILVRNFVLRNLMICGRVQNLKMAYRFFQEKFHHTTDRSSQLLCILHRTFTQAMIVHS